MCPVCVCVAGLVGVRGPGLPEPDQADAHRLLPLRPRLPRLHQSHAQTRGNRADATPGNRPILYVSGQRMVLWRRRAFRCASTLVSCFNRICHRPPSPPPPPPPPPPALCDKCVAALRCRRRHASRRFKSRWLSH